MAFQVPASKASKGQDQFEFQIGSKTHKVKRAKFVPISTLSEMESNTVRLVEFFGPAAADLDRDQFAALVQAWRGDSELTAGESPASSS